MEPFTKVLRSQLRHDTFIFLYRMRDLIQTADPSEDLLITSYIRRQELFFHTADGLGIVQQR
jgi:hypothetical protein